MHDRTLTFGEIVMGIRQGDWRLALGFLLECLIMASPILLIGGAIIYGR